MAQDVYIYKYTYAYIYMYKYLCIFILFLCTYPHAYILQSHIYTNKHQNLLGKNCIFRVADLQFVATKRTHQRTHHFLSTLPSRHFLSFDIISRCRNGRSQNLFVVTHPPSPPILLAVRPEHSTCGSDV